MFIFDLIYLIIDAKERDDDDAIDRSIDEHDPSIDSSQSHRQDSDDDE